MLWRNDDESLYGDEVHFIEDVHIADAEFVRVRCYANNSVQPVYTNFHALALLKPDVERCCDEALRQRRPSSDGHGDVNVLMVGVDSTSRLNSVRRFNSTRQFFLRQLHVSRSGARFTGEKVVRTNLGNPYRTNVQFTKNLRYFPQIFVLQMGPFRFVSLDKLHPL